jgi:hypothetical protein
MLKVALLIFVFACYVIVNDPAHLYTDSPAPTAVTSVTSVTPDNTPGNNIFNENATLDNSQIDYSDDTPVILPSNTTTITPTVLLNGTYVPEESPDGGYPVGWLDNSPVYSDGWMLQVNDRTGITSWIAPTPADFGAGSGAVCGTDAQCADYSRSIGEEPSGYAQGK